MRSALQGKRFYLPVGSCREDEMGKFGGYLQMGEIYVVGGGVVCIV